MIVLPHQANLRRLANMLLCRGEWGDLATLTALGTLESGTAIGNLQLDQPADFTGFAAASTPGFRAVRATNVRHHLIALVATNATSAATWRVREGDSQTESDGTQVYDSSGEGHHGSFVGGAGYSADAVGMFGRALRLDNPTTGANAYVEVPGSTGSAGLDWPTFTYAGWIKPDVVRAMTLVRHFDSSDPGRRIRTEVTGNAMRLAIDRIGGGGAVTGTGVTFGAGAWVHVAITFDGARTRIYVNSTMAVETPGVSGAHGGSDGVLRLGAGASGEYGFSGLLDDWRFYDYELLGGAAGILDIMAGEGQGDLAYHANWRMNGFDSGSMPIWLAPDLDTDWPGYHSFVYVPDGLTTRYQRIDCADAANPSSNLRIGRYICGEAVQFSRNRDHGMTLDIDEDGRPFADFRYALVPEAEWLTQGHHLVRTCRPKELTATPSGQTILRGGHPVLAIFDPNDPAFGQHKTLYGALESRGGGKNTFHGLWEYEGRLTGML